MKSTNIPKLQFAGLVSMLPQNSRRQPLTHLSVNKAVKCQSRMQNEQQKLFTDAIRDISSKEICSEVFGNLSILQRWQQASEECFLLQTVYSFNLDPLLELNVSSLSQLNQALIFKSCHIQHDLDQKSKNKTDYCMIPAVGMRSLVPDRKEESRTFNKVYIV